MIEISDFIGKKMGVVSRSVLIIWPVAKYGINPAYNL